MMMRSCVVAVAALLCWRVMHAADQNAVRSLSFVYYPTSSLGIGHAELEMNDMLWDGSKRRSFPDAIRSSTYNRPFFRFVFNPPAVCMQDMQRHIKDSFFSLTCSRTALHPLAQTGVCSVPFAISVSPLYTALYLKAGSMLGLNNVKRIEYYGNPSLTDSVSKMLPGAFMEAAPCIVSLLFMVRMMHLMAIFTS